jgi:hypothetical protein
LITLIGRWQHFMKQKNQNLIIPSRTYIRIRPWYHHFSEQVPAFCQFFLSPFSYDISLLTHSFVPKPLTAQLIDFDLWMIWNYLTIYFDNLYL